MHEGERDVDQVDGEQDRVGDNPRLVRRQRFGTILLGVVNQLALILLVEYEQPLEVDPTVSLLWAFHIHADDEDVLCVQIDQQCVSELDPIVVVDVLGRGLDDNVDLMRHTLDSHNLVFGMRDNAGHNTGVSTYHGVLVVGRHADQLNFAHHLLYNASINLLIILKMLSVVCCSNIGMDTRCRFTRLPR